MTTTATRTTRTRHLPVLVVLALCCSLASCGTLHADASAGASATGGATAGCHQPDVPTEEDYGDLPDTTDDDPGGLPDMTTDDDPQELPDATTDDDPGELPDTTTDDDAQELPDTTSDDYRELPDTTSDTPADTGAPCWFPMRREFRAFLVADGGTAADAAVAPHVESVYVRTSAPGGRTESVVRVDYGVGEQDGADRTARGFARWRNSDYGDHGHVKVLGPAKTVAERSW
ncbi:hypothetical protein GT045_14965 [Streptomyces sp. SID486]|uniref:hypothetical protein n=1 Tax=Streptomyces sp. SID486 TaxID=2690264 RepID=UPI00136E97D5|nr:hypothetical protein [Streptomyces sp. SID486]MYX96079.1 hypothetical protein [Streptomyces sp. SID486]